LSTGESDCSMLKVRAFVVVVGLVGVRGTLEAKDISCWLIFKVEFREDVLAAVLALLAIGGCSGC
jgi:hypothetical protein